MKAHQGRRGRSRNNCVVVGMAGMKARISDADSQRIAVLERKAKQLRSLVTRLARALCTHTRTDLAPDAALPAMRKLVADLERKE